MLQFLIIIVVTVSVVSTLFRTTDQFCNLSARFFFERTSQQRMRLYDVKELDKFSKFLGYSFRYQILKAFSTHRVSIITIRYNCLMDPSQGNPTTRTPNGGTSNDMGRNHFYNKEPTRIGQTLNGDNNLQLVHLLTTNPAAALPAIFTGRGGSQKVFPRRTFQMNRAGRMSSVNHSYRGSVCNNYGDQIVANSWTASLMSEKMPFRKQRSFSELYASKEEIEKKGCCIDKEGNFNFEALLPVVYWRPDLDSDFPLLDDS